MNLGSGILKRKKKGCIIPQPRFSEMILHLFGKAQDVDLTLTCLKLKAAIYRLWNKLELNIPLMWKSINIYVTGFRKNNNGLELKGSVEEPVWSMVCCGTSFISSLQSATGCKPRREPGLPLWWSCLLIDSCTFEQTHLGKHSSFKWERNKKKQQPQISLLWGESWCQHPSQRALPCQIPPASGLVVCWLQVLLDKVFSDVPVGA